MLQNRSLELFFPLLSPCHLEFHSRNHAISESSKTKSRIIRQLIGYRMTLTQRIEKRLSFNRMR